METLIEMKKQEQNEHLDQLYQEQQAFLLTFGQCKWGKYYEDWDEEYEK